MKTLYLIIAVLVAGLLAGAIMFKGCGAKKEDKILSNIAEERKKPITWSIDDNGKEHATKPVIQATTGQMDVFWKHRADSACKELGIAKRQITALQDIVANVKGSFTTTTERVKIKDTTAPGGITEQSVRMFEWSDDYLSQTGYIEDGDTGQVHIFYEFNIALKQTNYWRYKHKFPILRKLWDKKIIFFDISCDNKNVHITGMESIQIK